MAPSTTTLPELPEADAVGDIRDIYAGMRHLAAAPMVALIWRHLATLPGALPAAWAMLGPLYRQGLVQEAAWRTAERAVTGPPAGIGRRLAAAGLGEADATAFGQVLAAYNRVNPVNYVAVRLVLRALGSGEAGPAAAPPSRDWTPPPAIGPLPPMAPIADIPADHRRMLDAMSSDPAVDRSRVVPTLYRHLVGWPGLIPLIHDALIARFRSGEIKACVIAVQDALTREAARLAPAPFAAPEAAALAPAVPTLQRFSALIPEMVVVGTLLARGMAER